MKNFKNNKKLPIPDAGLKSQKKNWYPDSNSQLGFPRSLNSAQSTVESNVELRLNVYIELLGLS